MARLATGLALASAAAPTLADVPAFRGGAERTGVYAPNAGPRAGREKWRFATGGPVVSSPAVVGEVVYVGSHDRHLYALGAADGRLLWKFETGSRVSSSPAVADGRVYFVSYDGRVYALDAANGTKAWQFATQGERRFAGRHLNGSQPAAETMPDPFDLFLSSPAVVDGTVYVGSGDGHVYALDARTGTLRWKFATGDVVHASPTVVGGIVYVGSWDSWFYALDAASGELRWRFKTGEDPVMHNQVGIQSSAVVADGIVYFGCRDSRLYAVDAATGRQRFAHHNGGAWVIGTPVVAGGHVYFATSDGGLLHALDARTGAPAWRQSHVWPMFSSPVVAGTRLYLGTHAGYLLAVERDTGALAWRFQTEGSKRNGPTYTTADGQPNYAVAFEDSFYDSMVIGLARMLSVGAVLSTPALVGGVAYFGSADGHVYAVE